MADPPVACSLDPGALAARRAGLLDELRRRASACAALPGGIRFTFAADSETLDLIARAIDAERRCCRFLTFHLTVAADLGSFVLDLTGPAGTREFLGELLQTRPEGSASA
jgi:hypothetical protein